MTQVDVTTSETTVTVISPTAALINVTGEDTTTVNQNQAVLTSVLQNVDTISSPSFVQMNTNATVTPAQGRFWWSNEDNTYDFGMTRDNVLQLGQEIVYPPVNNQSGVLIPKGTVVMATGVQGDRILIAKAVTNGTVDFNYIIGVAAEDIPNGVDDGHVIQFGIVRMLDTSAYPVGTILYPNPANGGGLTDVKPDAPAFRLPIAIVLRQQAQTGRILVRMSIPSGLGESDTNVQITDPQDGDVLKYDAVSGLWKNEQP
jgi:hypothetical protein